MSKKLLILLITALSTLVACKKPKDDTSTSGSKILKRMIETKSGVTTNYDFSYDNNKRLISIITNNNSEAIFFTYDGSGNVVKIEDKEDDIKNVFEFTYNNGIPATGVFKSFENAGTPNEQLTENYNLAYTVENGMVTKFKMIVPPDPATQQQGYEINYNLTYSNGNVTKIETSDASSFTATFTYGNKKPVLPIVSKYALDPDGFTLMFFAKNEILTTKYDFPGNDLDSTTKNEYTYDAQGYVLTSNDGETQTKFEYE